jgi:hypothetical protein
MANPTTNYGFVLPTATDLVTDLPADFDVALQGVDTRLKALQPGTTLGDLAYSSATANTNTRLAIGSTSQVLTVTGGVPVWATPAAGGGMTLLGSGTLSGATVTVSSIPGTYKNLTIILDSITQSTTAFVNIRINNSTTNVNVATTFSSNLSDNNYGGTIFVGSANSSYKMNPAGTNAFQFTIYNYAEATQKAISGTGGYQYSTDPNQINFLTWGSTTDATAYNRIDFVTASGTFSSGNYKIYGVS